MHRCNNDNSKIFDKQLIVIKIIVNRAARARDENYSPDLQDLRTK